jgi:hypothetical protein
MNGSGATPLRHQSTGDLGSNQVVQATEGWLELFLTPAEKLNLSKWQEVVRNKSLVHYTTRGLFDKLANRLPDTLAPSLITLTGFLVLGNAWYLTNAYAPDFPIACTWLAMASIFFFFCCSSMVGHHADRIRQHTALTDLFKYSCDCCSTVWLAILTTYCLGGGVETQWYAVQCSQLVLFLKHLSAFKRKAGMRYHLGAGPGEVLISCIVLLATRAIIGMEGIQQMYQRLLQDPLVALLHPADPDMLCASQMVRILYYGFFVAAILQSLGLKSGWTRFGLIASLLMRLIPALLLHLGVSYAPSVFDVICDGLFMAVLTSDLTLAKMASRELHPWVVVMSLAAVLSYTVILLLVATYYIAVLTDLCSYLNLPLFTNCRNVYCDGGESGA